MSLASTSSSVISLYENRHYGPCLHRPTFVGGSNKAFSRNFVARQLIRHTNTLSRSCKSKVHRTAVHSASPTCAAVPQELQKIIKAFQMVPNDKLRYQQLLFFAKKLAPLPAADHTDEHKVRGCVSQVWMVPEVREGNVYWSADSDSQLTKGLAALLVQGLSGIPPAEIVEVSPDFIKDLGLTQSLTPSRNNGFLNMFRLMQQKCVELASQGNGAEVAEVSKVDSEVAEEGPSGSGNGAAVADAGADGTDSSAIASPVKDSIERKLQSALQPVELRVVDNSSQHAGHAHTRMSGHASETHFQIEIISEAFQGLNSVKRHRRVYDLLKEELAGSVHALSLVTKTPVENSVAAR